MLVRTYHWISLFNVIYKVSKLAYRIWVILIANKRVIKNIEPVPSAFKLKLNKWVNDSDLVCCLWRMMASKLRLWNLLSIPWASDHTSYSLFAFRNPSDPDTLPWLDWSLYDQLPSLSEVGGRTWNVDCVPEPTRTDRAFSYTIGISSISILIQRQLSSVI
jgi:hypothetical protein